MYAIAVKSSTYKWHACYVKKLSGNFVDKMLKPLNNEADVPYWLLVLQVCYFIQVERVHNKRQKYIKAAKMWITWKRLNLVHDIWRTIAPILNVRDQFRLSICFLYTFIYNQWCQNYKVMTKSCHEIPKISKDNLHERFLFEIR